MERPTKVRNAGKAVEVFGFTLTGTIAFVLNIIIVIAVLNIKRPYICTKISLHLAVSNAIGSILVIVLQGCGDTWLIEHSVCHLFLVFKSFWCMSAMMMTCFLVYESFFKTKSRLKYMQMGNDVETAEENCLNVRFTIILLWVSSFTVAFITFLMLTDTGNSTLCISYQHTRRDLVQFYLAFIVVMPLMTIALLNIIYKRLSMKHKKSVGVYTNRRPGKRVIQRHFHYSKSCFRLGQVLQVLWLPHTIYTFCLIDWFIDNISFHEIAYHMLKLLQWFCYSSCICQPLAMIYTNYQIKLVVLAKAKAFWYSSCCSSRHTVLENRISNLSSVYDIENTSSYSKNKSIDETDSTNMKNDDINEVKNEASREHDSPSEKREIVIVHNESVADGDNSIGKTSSGNINTSNIGFDYHYDYPTSPETDQIEEIRMEQEETENKNSLLLEKIVDIEKQTVENQNPKLNKKTAHIEKEEFGNENPNMSQLTAGKQESCHNPVPEKEITDESFVLYRPEPNTDKMFSMELTDDKQYSTTSI